MHFESRKPYSSSISALEGVSCASGPVPASPCTEWKTACGIDLKRMTRYIRVDRTMKSSAAFKTSASPWFALAHCRMGSTQFSFGAAMIGCP